MSKKKQKINKPYKITAIIIILLAAVITLTKPLYDNTKFGLDLQGGFEVLYQVNTVDNNELTDEMVKSTYKTILKRIDVLGVTEPNISIEGKDKIRVQLAGVENADEARRILSTTANLTFRDVNDNLILNSDILSSGGASVSTDQTGMPAVGLSISDKEAFFKATETISKMPDGQNMLVIWLDYQTGDSYQLESNLCGTEESNCLSAATVSRAFSSDVIIQGDFTTEEVSELVELINSGSLPTRLEELSSKTVTAAFGDDSLNLTLRAGIVGIILIMAVMTFMYHFAGFITSISIILYTFTVFLLFFLIGGVLTLPGIAALVIGIGMAIDASVITYSRIKEEMYEGRSLKTSFKNGIKRSLITILDANLTTLLVAIILFIFGESSVKGFATMFIITIISTIIIMYFFNKYILKEFINTNYFNNKPNLFIKVKKELIPNLVKKEKRKYNPFKNLDVVEKRKKYFLISTLIIIAGLIATFTSGLNLGIDYIGGSNVSIISQDINNQKQLEEELKDLNIVKINQTSNGYNVRIENILNETEILTLKNNLEKNLNAKTEIEVISNVVKKELVKNAILSVILATLGIIIYITLRYRFTYAISAIIALIHDVLITLGIFSLFQIEINTMFIAAILAIIGYSINDSIVCFDRIRETYSKEKIKTKEDLQKIINESIRKIFGRSLITSLTTLIPVTALILLGSYEIINFNIALFIGLIIGTYSSIFIASQIWYELEKNNIGKSKKSRWEKYLEEETVKEKVIKGIND